MARFFIEKHKSRQPLWQLQVLAQFPYDRSRSYPDVERYAMLETVLRYLAAFTYRRRNAVECLGITHRIEARDGSITVKTLNDVPCVTIKLITED